jgi:protease I
MASALQGRTIAFVVANEGIEQAELTSPWDAVLEAGGRPVLVATKPGTVQAFHHLDKGDTFPVDQTTEEARVDAFDGLMLPGGVANADQLRTDQAAVGLVRAFVDTGRPIAVICHGPWALVEADRVRDRTLTSWPSLQTDIRNAGGPGSTRRCRFAKAARTSWSAAGSRTTCRRSTRPCWMRSPGPGSRPERPGRAIGSVPTSVPAHAAAFGTDEGRPAGGVSSQPPWAFLVA